MLRTMVTQLIEHERIQTTLPKAKELRKVADRVVTYAKKGDKNNLILASGVVRTERELHKLFTTLAARYAGRAGGYTRVVHLGRRQHDAAPMAYIECAARERAAAGGAGGARARAALHGRPPTRAPRRRGPQPMLLARAGGRGAARHGAAAAGSPARIAPARPRSIVFAMSGGERPFGAGKPSKKGFIVLVQGRLGAGQMTKFQELFAPLAAHVATHEAGCSAYELSLDAADPDRFIIYERYESKDYLESVHWQSEPFKAFQASLGPAGVEFVEKSVSTFVEVDVGF
ncbi:rplQ [Scenedesmus sp. PABB004]|nr:rplQ [Scenedesmus sp. PABB004]